MLRFSPQVLNAEGNLLTELPAGLEQMTSLVQLLVSFNRLREIPAGVWQLPTVRNLHASKNDLATLPSSWEDIRARNLEYLSFGGADLTFVPE